FAVVVLDELPAEPRIDELAVLRQYACQRLARSRQEAVPLRSEPGEPALRVPADEAVRPAARQRDRALVVAEFLELLAEIVDGLHAAVVADGPADAEPSVEREERPLGREHAAVPVARVGE